MNNDLLLLLVGAGIALVSSIIMALVNYVFSLKTDKVTRERDKNRENEVRRREILVEGIIRKPNTICLDCKRVYPHGMTYCPQCGQKLKEIMGKAGGFPPGTDIGDAKICPQCYDINMPEAQFCDSCGAVINQETKKSETPGELGSLGNTATQGRHANHTRRKPPR